MKLGTENRKKTIAAAVLVGLAVILVIYRIIFPTGSSPSAAVAPPVARTSATTLSSPQAAPRRTTSSAKSPSANKPAKLPASLDPTLQLGLLQYSEGIQYTGKGRNIFHAEVEIPKPIASPVKDVKPQQAQLPPGPPPPPPINLKFFGFASKPGEPKRIFLSKGDDVFIAGEGDIVDRRYKVLRITPSSVEIEDVLNNNRQSIPLTQG